MDDRRIRPKGCYNSGTDTTPCTCDNPKYGMNCVCEWVRSHPGNRKFACEFDGVYSASSERCGFCEEYE